MTTTPNGLTLRDYLAAQAMQGLLAAAEIAMDGIAPGAYRIADAMLEARTAAPPPSDVSKSETARPS